MYVKDSVSKGIKVVQNHYDTIIWIKLDKLFFNLSSDVFIAGVYLWGESSPAYNIVNVNLFEILQNDVNIYKQSGNVYLVGDFNARVGLKKDFIVCDSAVNFIDDTSYYPDTACQRQSMDTVSNSHGLKLIDLCKSTSLRLANGRLLDDLSGSYTFVNNQGSSVIDYLLLPEHNFQSVKNFKVESLCEWSDHCPLTFSLVCKTCMNSTNSSQEFLRVSWSDVSKDEFRRKLIGSLPMINGIVNNMQYDVDSINNGIHKFTNVLNDIASQLFHKKINTPSKGMPSKGFTSKKAEWFDDECRNAKTMYFSALADYNNLKNDANRINMLAHKSLYKKLVKKKRRQFEMSKIREIESLRHSKPKDFWKLFSKKKNQPNSAVSVQDFYEYFSSLQSEVSTASNEESEAFCNEHNFNDNSCRFEELDKPITLSELESVIHKLKRNKAYGNDMLINEYFIECFDILSSHLLDMFNKILDSGHFPLKWSEGVIVPVFKKNDPCIAQNYRGITLVSCLSKIFTSVINKRLNEWVENNNILSDAQFGFRRGRSTIDAIFVLNAIVDKILSERKKLYCTFVDMKRAFDSVYLNGLWLKLFKAGVDGKMLRIVKDMYFQVKSCVKCCNSYSEYFECAVGLKQGEVISPLLFSLFIDDLELFLQDDVNSGLTLDDITIILMLFADDMVIFGKSPQELQNSLNLLHTYCLKWGLEVNTAKTKIMVFRKRGPLSNDEQWSYDNNKLEIVDNFNYLGTVFNYTGTFVLNQENLAGKGLKALNVFMNNIKQYPLKPSIICQLLIICYLVTI